MLYLVYFLCLMLISVAIGGLWIVLDYHVEIKITKTDCFWFGEIHNEDG